MIENGLNLGGSLTAGDIQAALTELNPLVSFDAAENRPSDYQYVLKDGDNMASRRGGIFFNGRYVCAMDRGVIPEKTVWEMQQGFEEIRMCDIDRYDDSRVVYVQIMESDRFYNEALLKAERGDDNFILEDGKVYKYTALRETLVPSKVLTIGWRATLMKLASVGIPNVTLPALEQKLGVRV